MISLQILTKLLSKRNCHINRSLKHTTVPGVARHHQSHSSQECPAWNPIVTCYKCSKKGHVSTFCCSTGSVKAVQLSDHEQDITYNFLGAVKTMPAMPAKPWTVPLAINIANGLVTTFKIDTRADVTGIPKTVFKKINNTTLQLCSRAQKGPSQNSLKVIGQFQDTLTYKSKQSSSYITRSSCWIASNRGTRTSDQN